MINPSNEVYKYMVWEFLSQHKGEEVTKLRTLSPDYADSIDAIAKSFVVAYDSILHTAAKQLNQKSIIRPSDNYDDIDTEDLQKQLQDVTYPEISYAIFMDQDYDKMIWEKLDPTMNTVSGE